MNETYCYELEYSIPERNLHVVHKIRHSYGCKNWYRMSISKCGFNNFCLTRFLSKHKESGGYYTNRKKYKNHKKTFRSKHSYDHELELEIYNSGGSFTKKHSWVNPNIPVIEHENYYTFYEFIGWDRKNKKFTKPELTTLEVK